MRKKMIRNDITYDEGSECNREGYLCTAGVKGFNLTANGYITPCTGYYRPLGNIRVNRIEEILNSPEAIDVKNTTFNKIKKCNSCSNLGYCSICPGVLYSEYKSVTDFSRSSLCEDAEIVKLAFIE